MLEYLEKGARELPSKLADIPEERVIVVIVAIMLALFVVDLVSFLMRNRFRHRDFKTSIVSLGILGTFIGVTIGLYDVNIEEATNPDVSLASSLPTLIGGLKIAFLTSVAGISLSVLLSVFQRFADASQTSTEQENLRGILVETTALREGLLKMIETGNQDLKQIADDTAVVKTEVVETKKALAEGNDRIQKQIKEEFRTLNNTLEQSLKRISEGANKEIIEALNKSIKGFNENLTEQFGENFKQLNAACIQLVKWQEQHKSEIEAVHEHLEKTLAAINTTSETLEVIAKRNQEIVAVHETIRDIIQTYDSQTTELNEQLVQYGDLADKAKQMFAETDAHFHEVARKIERSATTINDTISDATEAVTRSARGAFETAEAKLEATVENINRIAEDIGNDIGVRSKEVQNTLKSAVWEIGEELKHHTSETQKNLTKQIQEFGKMQADFSKMLGELIAAYEEMDRIFSQVTKELGEGYRKYCETFSETANKF